MSFSSSLRLSSSSLDKNRFFALLFVDDDDDLSLIGVVDVDGFDGGSSF